MDLIQYIGSIGGIAGVLAFFIFMTYKYLVGQMREDRKFMEDRLTSIIGDYNNAMEKHTQVLSELITWLKARNGHS
jgi:hypothetical protein